MIDRSNAELQSLLVLLQWLDNLLEVAITTAQVAYGTDAESDLHRGMQIDQKEVKRLLEREPASPVLMSHQSALQEFTFGALDQSSRLVWLQKTFKLSDFDLATIAIAIAPELDRRYERLYAYLQDDIRCKRPTVDLCLNLLCESAIDKLKHRQKFTMQSTLIRQGLLHLIPDQNQPSPPLLAHYIKLDPQIIHQLLETAGLDDRLHPCCQLVNPQIGFQALPFSKDIESLATLLETDWKTEKPVKLFFQGADQAGKRQVAEAIAHALQVPLIRVNLTQISVAEFDSILNVLLREALFHNALLYFEPLDALQVADRAVQFQILIEHLNNYPKVAILAGDRLSFNRIHPEGVLTVAFPMPDFEQRQFYWNQYLKSANVLLAPSEVATLSDRLRLTSDQIENAVMTATCQSRWHRTEEIEPGIQLDNLFAAAREISSQDLEGLCRQIQPRYRWDDLVLPIAQKTLLREICDQIKYEHLVWKVWGFDRSRSTSADVSKRSQGKGMNVMFAGPPGTGKTMTAEVIAQELQLDLYKIDLSQIVSKYIGETEKNLNHIFTAATNANAILLFDEADSLFGKRTEIKDSHDRYANLEVSYLLQKMEEYEGLAILTTNLRSNLDDAFVRRLQFIIEFPFPTERQRHEIWQQAFPQIAPCSPDLDLMALAQQFELSGANIRTIALAAAFLAASEENQIEMSHITQAVRREYQKMGKILALPTKPT